MLLNINACIFTLTTVLLRSIGGAGAGGAGAGRTGGGKMIHVIQYCIGYHQQSAAIVLNLIIRHLTPH